MVTALNSSWVDDDGNPFTAQITAAFDPDHNVNNLTNRMIIDELDNDRPIFYASRQHAMVLFQATYFDNPNWPDARIISVAVADPYPGNQRIHGLNQADMAPDTIPGGNMLLCATVNIS